MWHAQVEVHPLWRNDELIAYCRSQGIHVSAYCPLGTPWTSAKAVIRRAEPASQHPVIKEVAKKYSKHVLHIIMRWGLQHGTSILAKSSNPGRIKVWSHIPAPADLAAPKCFLSVLLPGLTVDGWLSRMRKASIGVQSMACG